MSHFPSISAIERGTINHLFYMQIIKINPMNYFPVVIWGMLFSVSLLILILNLGFQVNLEFEKSGDDLQMHFPITIATVPFRIPNSNQQPNIHYGNVRNKDLSFSMWNSMSQNIVQVSVCGIGGPLLNCPENFKFNVKQAV